MTADQLLEKIWNGENDTFELKTDIRDPLVLSKLIGSFANNKGGQIVVGVREPIEIVGADIRGLQKIVERTRMALKPAPKLTTETILIDNKAIFVINVEKSNEIVFSAGSVYQRTGEQIKSMSSDEIKLKLTTISTDTNSLETLANAIERQSKTIDDLREEIKSSNSWKIKLRDNFIGGLIGAILGFLLSLLLLL